MAAENNLKNFEPALRQGFKVTLDSLDNTGVATGSIIYYNGTAWVELAPGTNGQVLTMTAGIPAWV